MFVRHKGQWLSMRCVLGGSLVGITQEVKSTDTS